MTVGKGEANIVGAVGKADERECATPASAIQLPRSVAAACGTVRQSLRHAYLHESNHDILEHGHLPKEPQILKSPTHAKRGAAVRPFG